MRCVDMAGRSLLERQRAPSALAGHPDLGMPTRNVGAEVAAIQKSVFRGASVIRLAIIVLLFLGGGMRSVLLTSQSGPGNSLVILFIGLFVAFAMVIGLHLAGFDAVAALRDRSLSAVPEAGMISDLGILLMGFAAAVAALEAWRIANLPLGILALFCWLFAIDDAFLIHEAFGRWEIAFFGVYGLLAALVLYLFSQAGGRLPWPILIAIGAFAVSVLVDVLWGPLIGFLHLPNQTEDFLLRVGFVLEDVPKFGGILVLSSCAIGEAVSGRHSRQRESAT